ncbi:choline kinase-like protein [Xylariales sp. PMI_506]|nr:choline kinase-like protein [Xylariales sp. PMI_506]
MGGQQLRSALKTEDESERVSSQSASIKVQITEPETGLDCHDDSQPKKQFSAGVGKRLSGRPNLGANSSRTSLVSQNSLEALNGLINTQSPLQEPSDPEASRSSHRRRFDHVSERLIAQVAEWIEHEREKRQTRKTRRVPSLRRKTSPKEDESTPPSASGSGLASELSDRRHRSHSIDSQSSNVSLDRLQKIIDDGMTALGLGAIPHYSPRLVGRKSHRKRPHIPLHRGASSDTEYHDGDVLVPKCDAWLDNSKTLSYSGGKSGDADDAVSLSSRKEEKERKAWLSFKNEIIRIAHTLRIKGWRKVSLDSGASIDVERLSGALTNAVYVVSPPKELVKATEPGKKPPPKLLLRVYGPQVENIIDRENELSVLRRLARKKIGPRLLGTFENGRFEQFFNAITLNPANLREPDTSKQIAKRMRELHDGVELLEEEKDAGPAVFRNWDKWLDNVERVITFLDDKIMSGDPGPVKTPADIWKMRGLVCGVQWAQFKEAVERLRQWLEAHYGGRQNLREQLIFAHNDTQYGNILRVRPDDEKSPLLQPRNEHKQLIVIDFEYAAANVRGLEFANHFTEWTYNYHDDVTPHACNTEMYPKPEEQRRFIKAYVDHRPQYFHAGSTPNLTPIDPPSDTPGTPSLTAYTAGSTSSIVEFMLDARVPPGGWKEDERRYEELTEKQIKELMEETRLWRIANSAQWVAWGIMQAKVTELHVEANPESDAESSIPAATAPPEETEDGADGFDYLGYAQERALFFWGDCVTMGLVKLDELPEELRPKLKIVNY